VGTSLKKEISICAHVTKRKESYVNICEGKEKSYVHISRRKEKTICDMN
jgi:hypothetical protein